MYPFLDFTNVQCSKSGFYINLYMYIKKICYKGSSITIIKNFVDETTYIGHKATLWMVIVDLIYITKYKAPISGALEGFETKQYPMLRQSEVGTDLLDTLHSHLLTSK